MNEYMVRQPTKRIDGGFPSVSPGPFRRLVTWAPVAAAAAVRIGAFVLDFRFRWIVVNTAIAVAY